MSNPLLTQDMLSTCVHCGFCLEACPTYKLTGDENNSPRGRLRLWRKETEGRLAYDSQTDFYTSECIGCLACETVCPAGVPYADIFEQTRHDHVASGRFHPKWELRAASLAVKYPFLFNLATLPARATRGLGLFPHPLVFPGRPSVIESTHVYAKRLMEAKKPRGPRVALLTGCLMEAMFREINFATVRVLIENNVQVLVPEEQGCCGAFHEHAGLGGVEEMKERNRLAFSPLEVDAVVGNSAGCGRALQKTIRGSKIYRDVLVFLSEIGPVQRERPCANGTMVHVDLPCHLVHGQKIDGIPANVLQATGYHWQLAPRAKDCCGSGGIYNIQKPDNARAIIRQKAAFLEEAEGDPLILATSNHICMMQWYSVRSSVRRQFQVRHVIQLLDPEAP